MYLKKSMQSPAGTETENVQTKPHFKHYLKTVTCTIFSTYTDFALQFKRG